MSNWMKYKKSSHSSYLIQAHIIFVTKYRERKFTSEMTLWFPLLNQVAWRKNESSGYFACSIGGAPIEVLKQYIEQQDRLH
jgi:REP element-mobilizing transposase RayT